MSRVRATSPEPSSKSSSTAGGDDGAARLYQELVELGRGGTAIAYAGLVSGLGGFSKMVVLKKIREEVLGGNRELVRAFVTEGRVSARMNHPNVVQVHEVYREKKLPVIVMEYLDGQSLAKIQSRSFREPAYGLDLAVSILCRVLAGLQYAHTLSDYDGTPLQIVHRDVSPHNVMVTYDGQVKLLDFGIAKLSSSNNETKTGVIKGKVAYMAPEQLDAKRVDLRADLFAVGVMLWEAITRRRLWGGRSDVEIIRSLVDGEVPALPPSEALSEPELARICHKALAPHPAQRHASAAEFQSELEAYLARRGSPPQQSDIAEMICHLCADLRKRTQEQLRAALARVAAQSPTLQDALQAFERASIPSPALREHGPRRWPWAVAGLAVVIGLILGKLSVRTEASASAAASEPVVQVVPRVSLRVEAIPVQAELSLDGRSLGRAPLQAMFDADERTHLLELSAEGYQPLVKSVFLKADLALTLSLTPLPSAPPAAHPPAPQHMPRTKPAK